MKSYREQVIECKENGNLIEIDIKTHCLGCTEINKADCHFSQMDKILICLKYKCNCHSKACREERENEVKK